MLSARTRDSVTHWEILDNTFAAIGFRHRCLSLIFFLYQIRIALHMGVHICLCE